MEIYLVRHTTVDVPRGVCYGQFDVPLVEHAESEIAEVIAQLPESPTKVFSSPSSRCLKLSMAYSSRVIQDSRIMELDFGIWENQPWDLIPKDELDPWMDDYMNTAPPKGETYNELIARVEAFKREVEQSSYGGDVVIVTHGGVIKTWLGLQLRLEKHAWMSQNVGFGEVIRLTP